MRLCQGNRTKLRMDRITDRLVRWPTSFLGAVAEKDCFHVYNKTVRRPRESTRVQATKGKFHSSTHPDSTQFFSQARLLAQPLTLGGPKLTTSDFVEEVHQKMIAENTLFLALKFILTAYGITLADRGGLSKARMLSEAFFENSELTKEFLDSQLPEVGLSDWERELVTRDLFPDNVFRILSWFEENVEEFSFDTAGVSRLLRNTDFVP